jgi:mRNA-degrading endonuclease toxin of MazEF toxin-antitoxin module
MATGYVPDAGDIVGLQFDPQAGHEQVGHEQAGHEQAGHEWGGHRPAVVLSPAS